MGEHRAGATMLGLCSFSLRVPSLPGLFLQLAPRVDAVSGGRGTFMFPHLLYLVSKGAQDMHRERSDKLEVGGCVEDP